MQIYGSLSVSLSLSLSLSIHIYTYYISLSLSLCRSFWYVVSVSLVVASFERFGRSCSARSSCLFRPSGTRLGCSFCFASALLVRSIYLLCCRASPLLVLAASQLSSLKPVSPTLEVSSDPSCIFIFIPIMFLGANFATHVHLGSSCVEFSY